MIILHIWHDLSLLVMLHVIQGDAARGAMGEYSLHGQADAGGGKKIAGKGDAWTVGHSKADQG